MTLRNIFGLALLVLVSACEEDPVIYIPGKSIPVVYAVFNDSDTIHTVHLTRSFGARIDPKFASQNPDSLYFHDASVTVGFKRRGRDSWDDYPTKKVFDGSKDSGLFRYPDNQYYRIEYDLTRYSNVSNGMGLVTSVTENFKDSLRFDYETRQTLLNEPRLKKLKISPWDK